MSGFLTKKRIIWGVVILLVILAGYSMFRPKSQASKITTDTVKKQDIKRTVLVTGQVTSQTDLQLSFKMAGVVDKVNVKEGDKVKAGDVLAQLGQKDQLAALTTARGTLAQAQANYSRVVSGASNEDVAVAQAGVDAAQVTLDNAKSNLATVKKQQETLVKNAFHALLNSTLTAVPGSGNIGTVTATVSGTYTGSEQGNYVVTIYSTGGGQRFHVEGLEQMDGIVETTPQPLGTKGLYIQFSDRTLPSSNSWTIAIPNTQAANYVANYNAYQAAVQGAQVAEQNAQAAINTAQVQLSQQQAALALKKAQARPADVQAAEAQILSAQGQVQAAQAALENTLLRAPSDGVITNVDIKPGEQAVALKEAMVLQDINNLHLEANVSEANISDLKVGQTVDVTFDSLGPDRHFTSTVQTVNPASTVVSGVVNYKVVASLQGIPEVKPGMTANMTILVGQRDGTLAIPQRAVITGSIKRVRVIDDAVKKTYHEVEVRTGMEADGGVVEVTGGLAEGQEIVTFIKQ